MVLNVLQTALAIIGKNTIKLAKFNLRNNFLVVFALLDFLDKIAVLILTIAAIINVKIQHYVLMVLMITNANVHLDIQDNFVTSIQNCHCGLIVIFIILMKHQLKQIKNVHQIIVNM